MKRKHVTSQDGEIAVTISDSTAVTQTGIVVTKTRNGWFSPSGKHYREID